MNPVFGRKRADEFDRLLSAPATREVAADPAAGSTADLLALVATLREVPRQAPVAPRADFAADLRARLMVAADAALAPDTAAQVAARREPAVRRSPRERRLAAAVGGFAIVSATASMAVAAQSALPGDTLYPLKRAIENAQTGVQQEAEGKGTSLLDNATGRLDEVDALSRSGDDTEAITATLADFVTQAAQASDLLLGDYASTGEASSIAELRTFTADSMGALTSLQSLIPREARASLIEATQVITAIDVQAQGICPTCTDLPLMQAPVFAAQSIDALLDDALSPVLDPVLDAPSNEKSPTRPEGRRPGTQQGAQGGSDGASQPPATPVDTPAPLVPEQPTDSAPSQPSDSEQPGTILDNLNVKGSKDPIGDLLTGAGKSVDDVVKGVDTTLDGVRDGLRDGLGGTLGGLGGLGGN